MTTTATGELVSELAALERPSASAGSRAAAQRLAAELRAAGAEARCERERVHGTYWVPLGLLSGAGALGAVLPVRPGRLLAVAALAGIVDDLWVGRQLLRRRLPRRDAVNVVAEVGPPDAPRTVVVHAHHDAAHSGLVFHPAIPRAVAGLAPRLARRVRTTPPMLWGVAAGPALVAAGARRAGLAACAGSVAVMADVARAPIVPGANDNLAAAAALVALARDLAAGPPDARVLLVSTDSEESFLEGMRAFVARHEHALPRERTTFLCLESVGGEHLVALDGEGYLKLHRYPDAQREALVAAAAAAGERIEPRFRFRFATDGQIPLLAGYPAAVLSSVDWYRTPRNYHWPSDDAEHVSVATAQAAARVAAAFVRAPSAPRPLLRAR